MPIESPECGAKGSPRPYTERIKDSQDCTIKSLILLDTLLDRLADIIETQPTTGGVSNETGAPRPAPTIDSLAITSHEISLHADGISRRLETLLNRL